MILGGRILSEHAERVWSRIGHFVRGIRGSCWSLLALWDRQLRQRHREDDRASTGNLLEKLLEVHQSCLYSGAYKKEMMSEETGRLNRFRASSSSR